MRIDDLFDMHITKGVLTHLPTQRASEIEQLLL
jgi:hypothetical protein